MIDKCTCTLVDSPLVSKYPQVHIYFASTLSKFAWNPSKNANAGGIDKCTCTLVDSPRKTRTLNKYTWSSFPLFLSVKSNFLYFYQWNPTSLRNQETCAEFKYTWSVPALGLSILEVYLEWVQVYLECTCIGSEYTWNVLVLGLSILGMYSHRDQVYLKCTWSRNKYTSKYLTIFL